MVQEAFERLKPLAGSLELIQTKGPGTAGEQAAEAAAAGAEVIFVAGGDGTLNEALQGLVGTRAALGIIPAGTANVTAVEIGLGTNPTKAVSALVTARPERIACGVLLLPERPPRYFLAMAGAGLDAAIVGRVSPGFKRRFGKLSYWTAAFATLGQSLPEFNARIEDIPVRASFLLMSRVKNYGGDLEIARHADIRAPKLAAVAFEGRSSVRYLKYFAGVLTNRLKGMSGVSVASVDRVEISGEPDGGPDLQVDGEHAGRGSAVVEIVPDAISLLMPNR